MPDNQTTRLAHDRIGPSASNWRELRPLYLRIQRRHRALVAARSKQPGAKYPDYTFSTVGEIAHSLKSTAEEIVNAIKVCGYWMMVREDPGNSKETWLIEEDGE